MFLVLIMMPSSLLVAVMIVDLKGDAMIVDLNDGAIDEFIQSKNVRITINASA